METALAASEIASDRRDHRLAYALLRILVGVNLIMHGVSRMLMGAFSICGEADRAV